MNIQQSVIFFSTGQTVKFILSAISPGSFIKFEALLNSRSVMYNTILLSMIKFIAKKLPVFLKVKNDEIKLKKVFKSPKENKRYLDACCDALFRINLDEKFF